MNESIEFDIKVNGKQAKDSIGDVEKAQDSLSSNSEKMTKGIKANWVAIGASAAAVAVSMGALMKGALELEKTMFGLNEETKKWIANASSQYGVDQKLIAGFVQTGKSAGMAGEEIEKMIDMSIALGRAYPNESTESFIDNLTNLNRGLDAEGYISDVLRQKLGEVDLKTVSLSDKMKILEEATRGVNKAYDETNAAKAEKSFNNMKIAADNLGTSLTTLAGEAGIFDSIQDGLDWIRKKTEGATKALNEFASASDTAGGGGGGSWGDETPGGADKNKPSIGTGKGKPLPLTAFAMTGNAGLKEQMSINLAYYNEQVAANKKLLDEEKRASEEREREAKRAGDKLAQEKERQLQETLAIQAQFTDDYNHTVMTAYEYELSNLDKQYALYKEHVEDKAALDEWYAEQRRRLQEEYNEQMKAYAAMGDALTDGLTQGIMRFTETGKVNFKDMANSIIQDMIKIQIQSSMMSLFGSFSGGGEGILGGAFDMVFNAKGNAFSNGNVTAFAQGGVVGSPTVFPMANGMGLMGEAGAEAIMPLSRTSSGDLGVKSTPPIVNVNVQNYGNDNVKVEQSGDNIQVIISQIASSISRGTGDVGKAMESRYGLSKR